jgi:hypothetical protein
MALLLPLGLLAGLGLQATAASASSGLSVRVVDPGVLATGTTLTATVGPSVTRVEYRLRFPALDSAGTTFFLGSSTRAPFSVRWNGNPSAFLGSVGELVATAYDQNGASISSDEPFEGRQFRAPSVEIPGAWSTVANRAYAGFNTFPQPSLSDGAVRRTVNAGGGSFLPYVAFPTSGSSASFTLDVVTAAQFDLSIRRFLADQPSAPLRIAVNGVVVVDSQGFRTRAARSSDTFALTVPVTLRQGVNTVTLTALAANGPSVTGVYVAARG